MDTSYHHARLREQAPTMAYARRVCAGGDGDDEDWTVHHAGDGVKLEDYDVDLSTFGIIKALPLLVSRRATAQYPARPCSCDDICYIWHSTFAGETVESDLSSSLNPPSAPLFSTPPAPLPFS